MVHWQAFDLSVCASAPPPPPRGPLRCSPAPAGPFGALLPLRAPSVLACPCRPFQCLTPALHALQPYKGFRAPHSTMTAFACRCFMCRACACRQAEALPPAVWVVHRA